MIVLKRVFYLAVFHEENNEYWVSFPDFPGCFSQGTSIEDSFLHAQEALEMCIEERISNNEKLPKPTFQIDDNKDDIPVLMSCKCNTNKVVA